MIDILHQKPLLGRQINWAHPLAKGLVACWVFNEGSGNKVYDIASHKYDLDFNNGPIWAPGKLGHSILFDDGSSEYLARAGAVLTGAPITVSLWFVTDSNTTGQTMLALTQQAGGNFNDMFHLSISEVTNDIYWQARTGPSTAFTNIKSGVPITENVWHQAVGISASAIDHRVLYDGGNKNTDNTSRAVTGLTHTQVGVIEHGTGGGTFTNYMSGKIDLPTIWNRALTDDEVEWIYREPTAMFQQNRVRRFSVPAVVGDGQAFRLRAIEKY